MNDDYINDIPTDIPSTPRQEPRTFPYPIGLPPGWSTTNAPDPTVNHRTFSFSSHVQNPDIWTNPQPPLYVLITPQEIAERVRPIVEEAVRKALHPDGLPDETRFLQVEATDQDGQKWRGVLYGVKEVEVPE